jgi:hypothetical protein
MYSPNPPVVVVLASSDPTGQALALLIFLFAGILLTFFFRWFGQINARFWFYLKYQRRLGFSLEILTDQAYVPDWVTVGFWPLGFLLVMTSLAAFVTVGVISKLAPDSSPGVTGFLLVLLILPGFLYVFALVIKFFYNMFVHGAAMQDDAETAKAEAAERARRIAVLKEALGPQPDFSPLNQYRRYWLACLGDDLPGHCIALLENDATELPLWRKVRWKFALLPEAKEFKERIAAAAKRRGIT